MNRITAVVFFITSLSYSPAFASDNNCPGGVCLPSSPEATDNICLDNNNNGRCDDRETEDGSNGGSGSSGGGNGTGSGQNSGTGSENPNGNQSGNDGGSGSGGGMGALAGILGGLLGGQLLQKLLDKEEGGMLGKGKNARKMRRDCQENNNGRGNIDQIRGIVPGTFSQSRVAAE